MWSVAFFIMMTVAASTLISRQGRVVYFFDPASLMFGMTREKTCFIAQILPKVAGQLHDIRALQELEIQFQQFTTNDKILRQNITHEQLNRFSPQMARFCVGANQIYEFYDTHHNLWVTAGFQVSTTSSTTSAPLPGDCTDVLHLGGTQSKVYKIFPRTLNQGIDVYCDMETDGGGWVILQRRADGSVDFDLDWHAYEYGFGHLLGDVWLGNSLIHAVSSQAQYEVRFDLTSFNMEKKYAVYDHFSIEGPDTNYTLHLSGYHGDVGDSLTKYPDSDINGMKFTTFDRDNDKYDYNCADLHHSGGWWYNDCTDALLNAPYQQHEQSSSLYRIYWHTWQRATRNALKRTEIKIRPRTKTR